MRHLTFIPNHRNAIIYKETLLQALDQSGVGFETEIIDHHQYSEVEVKVNDLDFEDAYLVMKAVIAKGPPKC